MPRKRKSKSPSDIIPASTIGNYYGTVMVCRINGKPHVTVENYNGCEWQPCSEQFYAAFVKEFA